MQTEVLLRPVKLEASSIVRSNKNQINKATIISKKARENVEYHAYHCHITDALSALDSGFFVA